MFVPMFCITTLKILTTRAGYSHLLMPFTAVVKHFAIVIKIAEFIAAGLFALLYTYGG